jgi:hypothetical protein
VNAVYAGYFSVNFFLFSITRAKHAKNSKSGKCRTRRPMYAWHSGNDFTRNCVQIAKQSFKKTAAAIT